MYPIIRRFVLVLIYFSVNVLLYGQFISPGNGTAYTLQSLVAQSGGTVTFQNGYYSIQNSLTISSTDTLKVLEDITIKINSGVLITINGVLIIDPPAQVVITSVVANQHFKGFRFENSHASIIRKTLFEYGGGLQVISSNLLIEQCQIRYFNKSNTTGAIQVSQCKPVITGCQIHENQGPAIASAANALAAPKIIGNHLWSNNTSNANTPQINLGNSGPDTILIVSNTITGFYTMAGGIAVSTLAGGSVRSLIEDNIITGNRYGIAILGNNAEGMIRNNIITNNNIQNIPEQGGSGINLNGGNTNRMIISGNTIQGNLWGVTVQGQAVPNLGETGFNPVSPGGNFMMNNGNGGTIYALYNNTPQPLFAQNNYWGSYNIDTIEMYIFHQPDNPALGWVTYLPLMPPPVGNQSSTLETTTLVEFIYPSPFSRKLHVVLNKNLLLPASVNVTIIDIQGSIVHQVNKNISLHNFEINLPVGLRGIYLLKIQAGNRMEIRTFMAANN